MTSGCDPSDPIDPLLEECLGAERGTRADVLARLCAEHPELADELRARCELLEQAGLDEVAAAPASAAQLAPGSRFGEFHLLRELGRGGMGVVYLAEQPALGRQVALKLIRPDCLDRPRTRARFRREIQATSQMEHPAICTVYEAGEQDGIPYIAMRYVEGESLGGRLARARAAGAVPATQREVFEAVQQIEQVARALHYAHERGFVHRDVKPQNILLDAEGRPVLADFGLARLVDGAGDALTLTADMLGTPAYLPPEQVVAGPRAADRRGDVYALGVTLFECLTLRLPFDAATREDLYRQILAGVSDASTRLAPPVPRDLGVVLATALARDPAHRYASALALADDLRRVRALEPIAARRPSPVGRAWRWARREPVHAALLAAACVGACSLAGLAGYLAARMPAIEVGERSMRAEEIEQHLARAFHDLHAADRNAALAGFDRALELDPDDEEALGGRVLTLHRLGETDAALAALDRRGTLPSLRAWLGRDVRQHAHGLRSVELTESATPVERFFAGLVELERGAGGVGPATDRALELLYEAVLRLARRRYLYYEHVMLAAGQSRSRDRTLASVRALRAHWPELASASSAVARALLHVDPVASEAECRRLIAAGVDVHEARAVLAELHLLRRKPREALALLADVHAARPDHEYGLRLQATAHRLLGDLDAAQAAADRAVALSRNVVNLSMAATLLEERGARPQALALIDEVLALQPDHAEAHCDRGRLLGFQGRTAEAEREYHESMRLDPRSRFPYLHLFDAHYRRRELEPAEAILCRLLAARPQQEAGYLNLALVHLQRGEHARSLACYDRALELDSPDEDDRASARLFAQVGRDMAQDADWQRAAAAYRKAIDRGFDIAGVNRSLGIVLAKAGDATAATAALRRATQLEPGDATALIVARAKLLTAGADVTDEVARALRTLVREQLSEELSRNQRVPADRRSRARAWLADPALQPLRDPAALAGFEPPERAAHEALWRDVVAAAK